MFGFTFPGYLSILNGLAGRSIRSSNRPEAKRHWHQSDLPDQVDRLAAAHAKRQRRAEKYQADYDRSLRNNPCRYTRVGRISGMNIDTGKVMGPGTLSIAPAGRP